MKSTSWTESIEIADNDEKDIKEQENGQPTYTIVVNENHFIYKAHFPNNPITPGVCMVQMIEEIMKER